MTGLEALERIENEYSIGEAVFYKEYFKQVRKSLKALEIIKEKRVNIGTFIHLTKVLKKDYEQCKATNDIVFCNICDDEKEFLTEEEFNLLKEVLEWFLKCDHW